MKVRMENESQRPHRIGSLGPGPGASTWGLWSGPSLHGAGK